MKITRNFSVSKLDECLKMRLETSILPVALVEKFLTFISINIESQFEITMNKSMLFTKFNLLRALKHKGTRCLEMA
ncbi:hypothetical protein DEAC_c41470 [Desulfosporosinus acididurans]|uniref:Uncharacterized protein n=1 Tax=Desulfosporosinus acididurans TaxID=476652 RepID=A0A0J1FLU8_9FIRM|nr:hypothetical protein DEAC_c41470 [Desulfosporosinus acididurans]